MSNYRYEGYGVVRDLRDDFPYHTDDIVELLNEKDQQISNLEAKLADLEHRLSNCIEPKFVVGQKIWFIDNAEIVCGDIEEFEYIISKYKQSYNYFINGYGWLLQKELFTTEEEAQLKLRSLEDE